MKVNTFGPEVASVAATAGLEPDAQQELGLDLLFAVHPDGNPVTFEFCVICARQNLKTSLFVMAIIGWIAVEQVPSLMWTAHTAETAVAGMRAVERAFKASPSLRKLLPAQNNDGFYDDASETRAEFTSGQTILFRTRTKDGARGLDTVYKLIADEALLLTQRQKDAIYPTLGAKHGGQVLLASTAGPQEAEVLREIRNRGRAGFSSRMTYLEWCASREPCRDARGEVNLRCSHPKNGDELGIDCALDREHLWREANPALAAGRMRIEELVGLRQGLSPTGFMRECLTWWEDPKLDAPSVFGPGRWVACQPARGSAPFPMRPTALGVAVSEDREWSSVAAAGLVPVPVGEGRDEYVEVPFVAPVRREQGTAWLASFLPRVQGETDCSIHMLARSGSSNLVDDIEDADAAVELVDADGEAQAESDMYDRVRDRRLVHNGASELDEAVAGADWRNYGRQQRVFVQRDPAGDISMLRAAALALSGVEDSASFIH